MANVKDEISSLSAQIDMLSESVKSIINQKLVNMRESFKFLSFLSGGSFSAYSIFLGSIEEPKVIFIIITSFSLLSIFLAFYNCMKLHSIMNNAFDLSIKILRECSVMKRRTVAILQGVEDIEKDSDCNPVDGSKKLNTIIDTVYKKEELIKDYLVVGIGLAGLSYLVLSLNNY